MPSPAAASSTGSALRSVVVTLLVLCAGMVVGSFAIPSSRFGDLDPSAPVRLVVPGLDLRASVVPVAVESQVLDPPQDPQLVGWWDASARPGAGRGQTVITGHTVHTGGGAMDTIDQLREGERVDVITKAGTMRYRVSDVEVMSKDQLAADARSLFGQTGGDGRLVLVSCDDWNGSYYESNVVVFGDPLGRPLKKGETA